MRDTTFTAFRKIIASLQTQVASLRLLHKLEHYIIGQETSSIRTTPIFIIGAPRTGSTLLFQLLLSTFRFAYITNLASFFYTAPTLVTKLGYPFFGRYHADKLTSHYGYINGLWSPSEAGQLLHHWFDHTSIEPEQKTCIQKTVATLSQIMNGPLLIKNLNVSVYLDTVHTIFPDACFIYIRRHPLYVAQSILLARKKLSDDISQWWSVRPPNVAELINLDPFEQIVWQIKSIENRIQEVLKERAIDRVLQLQYEEICDHWPAVAVQCRQFCQNFDIDLLGRHQGITRTRLQKSERQLIGSDEWEQVKRAVAQVYGEDEPII